MADKKDPTASADWPSFAVCKAERNALRKLMDAEVEKLKKILLADTRVEKAQLYASVELLSSHLQSLVSINRHLFEYIRDEADLSSQVDEAYGYYQTLEENILAGRLLLEERSARKDPVSAGDASLDSGPSGTESRGSEKSKTIKMAKLKLPEFDGDPMEWRSFWDIFEATVHKNSSALPIEKFNALKNQLKGEAFTVANGYEMTAANYDLVVGELIKRYSDPEVTKDAHLNAMLSMKPAQNDLVDLQRVFDDCERHVRCLVALGMPEDTFGRVFSPIIMSKLPQFLRIDLHRRNGLKAWTLENLRLYFQEELHVRRMSRKTFGAQENALGSRKAEYKDKSSKPDKGEAGKSAVTTVSGLVVSEKSTKAKKKHFKCRYCGNEEHFSEDCKEYPTLKARKDALKGSCERCLRKSHGKSGCLHEKWACFHCKEIGKHHRSLCP